MKHRDPLNERGAIASEDGLDPRPVVRGPMLRRLVVVLAGVLVGLVLVDRAVAWWDSDQGADGGERGILRHEQLVWTSRPHFRNPEFETVLDRYGNRSPDIPEDVPRDEVRIAGFGASRLYGAGGALQSWLWNYQLDELLERKFPGQVRVINGGVMAYSTLQACRRAALLLDALEPDLVFVIAAPGAQLMLDPSAAREQVRYGPGTDDLMPTDVAGGWPESLWPVVAAVHRTMGKQSAIYRRHRAKFQTEGADRTSDLQRWTVSKAPRSTAADRMFTATLEEIDALGGQCKRRGIELRVLVLPENDMGTDAMWETYLRGNQRSGAPPLGTPRNEPGDELERMLQERGHRTWNFLPEVSHMGPERARHTMSDNAHWSKAGHEVFAHGLLRRLKQENLIEKLAARRAEAPRARAFGPSPFDATSR